MLGLAIVRFYTFDRVHWSQCRSENNDTLAAGVTLVIEYESVTAVLAVI